MFSIFNNNETIKRNIHSFYKTNAWNRFNQHKNLEIIMKNDDSEPPIASPASPASPASQTTLFFFGFALGFYLGRTSKR